MFKPIAPQILSSSGRPDPSKGLSSAPASRSGDDIPVARRELPSLPVRRAPGSRIGLAGLALMVLIAALALVFPEPLRRWLVPPPVAGLDARLSADGRLLGHFPYSELPSDQLLEISPGVALQRDAARAVMAMQRAAASDGVTLQVLSAFRPIALQQELFFDVKSERNQSALERARVSAPPGFSEHSTGYAVDFGDGRSPQTNLSADFANTAAFRWLERNAARFHFTLSFPPNNPQGVNYEPWHWRYEGSAEALRVFEPAQRLAR